MADTPAFAILYGPRAAVSLAGIATIIAGTWKAETTFDELGIKAFENANAAGLEPVSKIEQDDLDTASPIPWITLAGWLILGLSSFLPRELGFGWLHFHFCISALIGFFCCMVIGLILAWPIREAYRERDIKSLVIFRQFLVGFGFVLLGSMTAGKAHGPWWFGFLGGKSGLFA